jgi:hypothetical protein
MRMVVLPWMVQHLVDIRTIGAEDAPSSLYVLAGQISAAALLQVMQNHIIIN